jgi:hypothetical protein
MRLLSGRMSEKAYAHLGCERRSIAWSVIAAVHSCCRQQGLGTGMNVKWTDPWQPLVRASPARSHYVSAAKLRDGWV